MRFSSVVLGVALGATMVLANDTAAQAAGDRAATLRVGGLMYDRGGDATRLMIGGGLEWTLSRHVLAEVEGSWAKFETSYVDYTQNLTEPPLRMTSTHLGTATAGIQAQALIGRVRPYIGLAGGLFTRYDQADGGDRFLGRTFTVPAGVRIAVTERIGVRGELRARFDTHQDGGSGVNVEQTVGVRIRL